MMDDSLSDSMDPGNPVAFMAKKPKRDDEPVKVERVLVERMRKIVEVRGLHLAEYISDLIRDQVTEDYSAVIAELQERLQKEKNQLEKEAQKKKGREK